jgi:hypothetical protein
LTHKTTNNELFVCKLPKPKSEESEDNNGEEVFVNNIDTLDLSVAFLGKFQGSQVIFSEAIEDGRLLSVEESGFLNIWDMGRNRIVSSELLKFHPTCCAMIPQSKHLIFGTSLGCLRVFKLNGSTTQSVSEVRSVKLGQDEVVESLTVDEVSRVVCAKIKGLSKMYFCRIEEELQKIDFHGFLSLDFEVAGPKWVPMCSQPTLALLVKGGLVMTVPLALENAPPYQSLTNLNSQLQKALVRRIDQDCEQMAVLENSQEFLTFGPSLVLRKYKWPTDSLSKTDTKGKFPNSAVEEYPAFDLMPQVTTVKHNKLFYGTENGELGVFDLTSQCFSTRTLLPFGKSQVNTLRFINDSDVVVGGADGSMFVVTQFERFLQGEQAKGHVTFAENEVMHCNQDQKTSSERRTKSKSRNQEKGEVGHSNNSKDDQQLSFKEEKLRNQNSGESGEIGSPSGPSRIAVSETGQQVTDEETVLPHKASVGRYASYMLPEIPLFGLDYSAVATNSIEHLSEDKVDCAEDLLFSQHLQSIEGQREAHRRRAMETLREHQEELAALKQQNSMLDEEFRLSSDEFCIDLERQSRFRQLSKEVAGEIKDRSRKETAYYDLVHLKVRGETFNRMETHLRAMAGFKGKLCVFNFAIAKVTPAEQKRLSQLALLRRMEMREREWAKENLSGASTYPLIKTIVEEGQPDFLINGGFGKQKMVLTDFEQREKELKDYEEERRKKKELLENTNNTSVKRRIELVNRRKRIRKNNLKNFNKTSVAASAGSGEPLANSKQVRRQSKEVDRPCNLVYSTLELTTINKKVSQMHFVKNLVRVIKEEFNQSFDAMFKIREKKLDLMNEAMKKVREICTELQVEDQSVQLTQNVLERWGEKY